MHRTWGAGSTRPHRSRTQHIQSSSCNWRPSKQLVNSNRANGVLESHNVERKTKLHHSSCTTSLMQYTKPIWYNTGWNDKTSVLKWWRKRIQWLGKYIILYRLPSLNRTFSKTPNPKRNQSKSIRPAKEKKGGGPKRNPLQRAGKEPRHRRLRHHTPVPGHPATNAA